MKIKKAILTGGGRATRLRPITSTINKHLLPLANKPMIFHAIEKVIDAGVTEIFINTNPGETTLQEAIGDGGHWNVKIHFFEQKGGPQGIAHVVNEAKEFIGNDPFLFYLSDNILIGGIKEMLEAYEKEKHDCMLALSEVPDPQRFGVPIFDDAGKLVDVIEKPQNPPNNYAVIGAYVYGPGIFFEAFDNIDRSARGEYEISDIHSYFLKKGMSVGCKEITGWWQDTGKPENLLLANKMLLNNMGAQDFPNHGAIHESAKITGDVHIGAGTQIKEGVTITGPVIIGENCVLEDCQIGPHVTIGRGSDIRHATIEDSMILENAVITHPIHLHGSMLGKGAQLVPKDQKREKEKRMILGDKTIIEF